MASERTQTSAFGHFSYKANQRHAAGRRISAKPVDAILIDRVELSGENPENSANYQWLTDSIARMSDESVARKMKQHRNSYPTIEDALAEKIIMEAI